MSPSVKAALVAATVAILGGCGGSAVPDAAAPEYQPEGQTKCSVDASNSRPLIIEWPAADRAALEARAKHGLIAVRYDGCEMEVLSGCSVSGTYGYTPITPKSESVRIRTVDELYAKLPVGAASLEGRLEQAGELDVNMTIVGRYGVQRAELASAQLTGSCAHATHLVTGITAGAFVFSAGASSAAGGGAEVLGAGAGARGERGKQVLNRDGDRAACGTASASDVTPPDGCGGLLRLEVTGIDELRAGSTTALAPDTASGSVMTGMMPRVKSGPGVVRVHLKSPAPRTQLRGHGVQKLTPVAGGFQPEGVSQVLCTAPCGDYVDVRAGQPLYVTAPDAPASLPLYFSDREGDVTLDVDPGNSASFDWGVASASVGILALVTGLSLAGTAYLIDSADEGGNDYSTLKTWGWATLAGGAVFTTVGIVLLNDGSTEVRVSGRPVR